MVQSYTILYGLFRNSHDGCNNATFYAQYVQKQEKNIAILIGSAVLFLGALGLVRDQKSTVDDVLWMKGMIPHHSIAILTSERADIKDPEVKKLADDIIKAQKKEIEEMKRMIAFFTRKAHLVYIVLSMVL